LYLESFIYLLHDVSPNHKRCSAEHYGSVEPDLGNNDIGCSDIDIFVNCNCVVTRWQYYSTHLHTNNTQNDTKQTIHRTTQQLWKSEGRDRSWLVMPWHLPYN